jgi:hypothetical protein
MMDGQILDKHNPNETNAFFLRKIEHNFYSDYKYAVLNITFS